MRNNYLAEGEKPYVEEKAPGFKPDSLKVLLSYHYFKQVDLFALMTKYFGDKTPKIFIDSGGFSAATQGVAINLDEYCEFLHKHMPLLHVYANLDEIGDPVKTFERQQAMEANGLKPLPVFHTGEPIEWLRKYIDTGHNYIALGGMVPYARDKAKLVKWMSACFNVADEYLKSENREIKYHGFGMTNWDLMRAYPWGSVDSSSWASGFRYGQVYLFDDKIGRFFQVGLRDTKNSYKFERLLHQYGFSPNDIAMNSEFDRVKVATISALAFMKAEAWLNRSSDRGSLRGAVPGAGRSDGLDVSRGSLPASGGAPDGGARAAVDEGKPVDRGSLRQTEDAALAGPDEHVRLSERGPGVLRDDRGRGEVYLVALPPKEGSEHNPESKFVGGTQMFESFRNILQGGKGG